MRAAARIAGLAGCLLLAGCSTGSSDSGSATEPTYAQAAAIAKRMLPAGRCRFQVDDQTTTDMEEKTLNCLTTVAGQPKEYTVFQYTRKIKESESDAYFGGFTTADAYFENANIRVNPSGRSEPGQPALDAAAFAAAVKRACGCGEVKTPTR